MSNHRLLIVDDDDFTRMTLSAVLDSLDCDVIGDAANEESAIGEARRTSPLSEDRQIKRLGAHQDELGRPR